MSFKRISNNSGTKYRSLNKDDRANIVPVNRCLLRAAMTLVMMAPEEDNQSYDLDHLALYLAEVVKLETLSAVSYVSDKIFLISHKVCPEIRVPSTRPQGQSSIHLQPTVPSNLCHFSPHSSL
jgi:hypothetical protein